VPRLLGDGLAPAFTPDDGMLVWVNGATVMSAALSWDDEGHLADAGSPAPLLSDGEVETAEVTRDRKAIVYATNIGEIGRRHLFSVGFCGGAPQAITGGHPSQWAPAPLADGELAYVEGSYDDPPTVFLRDSAGTIAHGGPDVPASFPRDKLVEPQLVQFPSAIDHQTVYGQLFVPATPRWPRSARGPRRCCSSRATTIATWTSAATSASCGR
jgi:dipeptidyl aminopeptidase/acylaminoacyl peptidase